MMATPEIMADLAEKVRRQEMGGFTPPPSPSRSEEIAEHLIRGEGARPGVAGILADMVVDRCRWPVNGGSPTIFTPGGQPDPGATMGDLLAELRTGFPECFAGGPIKPPAAAPSAPTTTRYAPNTLTARALAESATRHAAQATASNGGLNPYHPATRNLTQQVLLEKNDPTKAARLRAQAENR